MFTEWPCNPFTVEKNCAGSNPVSHNRLAISYYLQMLIDSMAKQYSGTDCRAAFGLIRLRPGALVTFFIQSSILLDFIIYFLFGKLL